jgi:hypothetical protein
MVSTGGRGVGGRIWDTQVRRKSTQNELRRPELSLGLTNK